MLSTVKLGGGKFAVTNSATVLPGNCQIADCTGVITLQNLKPATAGAAKAKSKSQPKTTTYGTARFSAKKDKTAKVKIKLNSHGKSLLKKHTKVTVYAYVKFTKGGGKATSFKITLKK